MSNQISFMVRVIDMTKQGLASAENGLKAFAKGAGFSNLGKMASMGAAGVALAFGALAKNVVQWADEIRGASEGAFDSFAVSGAKAIGNVTDKFGMFWSEVKANVVGALGSYFGGGEAATTDAMVEQVKKAEELKKAQLERIAKLKEELLGNEDLLAVKVIQLDAEKQLLAANPQNRDALEAALKLENQIASITDKIGADKKKQADEAQSAVKDSMEAWAKLHKEHTESVDAQIKQEQEARKKAIEEAGEAEKAKNEETHEARMSQLQGEIELRAKQFQALDVAAGKAEARGLGTMATRRAAREAQRAEAHAADDKRREESKMQRVLDKAREGRTLSGDEKRIQAAAEARQNADQAKREVDIAEGALDAEDKQYKIDMRELTKKIAHNVGAVM